MKYAHAVLVTIALLGFVAALLAGCGPLIYGGAHGRVTPSRFLVVIHNTDPGYHPGDPQAMTLVQWTASTVTSISTFDVPALGERTLDFGTVKPDGFQIVGNGRWAGIPNGPGGIVFQSPEYADGWIYDLIYPSGGFSIRR